ncbi:WASH complex subunit 7 [Armadillidium vulgare]|nr:WASH complex subunit 7 [Armadillidium vulgare]
MKESIVERELHRFSRVVEKHAKDLEHITETLEQHPLPTWHPQKDVINFKLEPFELVSDFSLIKTDNLILNKTVLALTSLCKEISSLVEEAEKDFYIPLSVYGNAESSEGDSELFSHLSFTKILPVLDHINNFINYEKKVVENILLQLSALYSEDNRTDGVHAGSAHFQVVFEHIGKLLGTIIIIDEIILDNYTLQNHFALYKKLIKSALTDPSTFMSTKKDLHNLKKFIAEIDNCIMSGALYKKFLSLIENDVCSSVRKNNCLRKEMSAVILGWSSKVEDVNSDGWWCEFKDQVLSITALYILFEFLFDSQDKRISKELTSLFKKVPCTTVAVNHLWMPEAYLRSHFHSLYVLFEKKSIESLTTYLLGWSSQLEATTKKPASLMNKQDLDRRAYLLWQGLILASSLKYSCEAVLGLHTAFEKPMSKTCVILYCHLLELLKAIEHSYYCNMSMLVDTLPHLRQYLSYHTRTLRIAGAERVGEDHYRPAQGCLSTEVVIRCDIGAKEEHYKSTISKRHRSGTRAKTERKLNKHTLDVLSALSLAEKALSGNGNRNRLLIGRISLSLVNQDKIISDGDFSHLLLLLRQLSIASDVEEMVRRATSTEFLFFHHEIIFKTFLQNYHENLNSHSHNIHYMLAAVSDCEYFLKRPKVFPYRDVLLKNLYKNVENLLKEELLDKLCKSVETALRLRTHSHLQLEKENPFEKQMKYFYPIIHLQPLKLFGSYYSVKDYVEKYLEKTFYNLTVVAPHDCSTYELMRNLAYSNLGLATVDSYLPTHTLDQGVDVLEIMRNLNVFVQHYQYNLNQQFFVEISSNNKHLNTVTIKHIANSIRTHGTGIINTTVNFTYQFLRRKFHVFSQFLYDEHIKSRLIKDLQCWKQIKEEEKFYPYERAKKLHKGIRKLGISSEGLSYLDHFRKLVTHIGNAIGYVRLVRSGCLHCSSSATQFIPDLQDVITFRIAYILKVLNQIEVFESLHWWSGVRRKFIAEKEEAERECGKTKEGDSKLEQTLSLTLRRLEDEQKAFELLFLGVSSAQVFFKGTDEQENDDTDGLIPTNSS